MKIGAPLCTRCYSWGHNMSYCNSFRMVCPICDGPHCEDNHCALATCCKSHPVKVCPVSAANLQVPSTLMESLCVLKAVIIETLQNSLFVTEEQLELSLVMSVYKKTMSAGVHALYRMFDRASCKWALSLLCALCLIFSCNITTVMT